MNEAGDRIADDFDTAALKARAAKLHNNNTQPIPALVSGQYEIVRINLNKFILFNQMP